MTQNDGPEVQLDQVIRAELFRLDMVLRAEPAISATARGYSVRLEIITMAATQYSATLRLQIPSPPGQRRQLFWEEARRSIRWPLRQALTKHFRTTEPPWKDAFDVLMRAEYQLRIEEVFARVEAVAADLDREELFEPENFVGIDTLRDRLDFVRLRIDDGTWHSSETAARLRRARSSEP